LITKKNKITTKRLKKNLHFRPIQLADIPFLQAVYASTRIDVQNNSNWTTLQLDTDTISYFFRGIPQVKEKITHYLNSEQKLSLSVIS